MIAAAEDAGALHRPEIADLLDHAQHRRIAARIGADAAGIGCIDIAAQAAGADLVDRFRHCAGERRHQLVLAFDHLERGPACAARAEARQLRQELDQPLDFGAGHAGPVRTAA